GWKHLGQFLIRFIQATSFRRFGHGVRSIHGRAPSISYAGWRSRIYKGPQLGQHMVDRAIFARQKPRDVRPKPVGTGPDGVIRELNFHATLAGEEKPRCRARQQDSRSNRQDNGPQLGKDTWALLAVLY